MATEEAARRSAEFSARKYNQVYVYYQVNNGEWMYSSKMYHDRSPHPRCKPETLVLIGRRQEGNVKKFLITMELEFGEDVPSTVVKEYIESSVYSTVGALNPETDPLTSLIKSSVKVTNIRRT